MQEGDQDESPQERSLALRMPDLQVHVPNGNIKCPRIRDRILGQTPLHQPKEKIDSLLACGSDGTRMVYRARTRPGLTDITRIEVLLLSLAGEADHLILRARSKMVQAPPFALRMA